MAEAAPPPNPGARLDGSVAGSNGPNAMIRLAAAMAVQDAVAHMRNTQMMAGAAIGMAEAMLLGNENVALANETIATAQAAMAAATSNFSVVGAAAVDLLEKFPQEPGAAGSLQAPSGPVPQG